ncbi:MAG: tyrosine-protein phosphatase [Novosphingobium sp.]|nr:tyrosine-protein phosphatase [Novosphingobium sp.]MCP5402412.1 tyrosine-protein phosphatase [Novosphingobium sp.]
MPDDRILPLTGVNNFRDYGGYTVAGGGHVKRGSLWRSGQHVAASDEDLEAIAAIGIATVIDLRGDSERQANPCRRPEGFSAEVLTCEGETAGLASHIDAGRGVLTEEDARAAMCRLYSEMPYRPNLVTVLRSYFAAIAEREGASLIHCFAGKDRTGFAVAITHHVLGVHYDDAMQDYLLTNAATRGRGIPGNAGTDNDKYSLLSEAASNALRGVSPEYLDAAFVAMRDSHGSVDAYLEDVLAVDSAARSRILENFVET